MASHVSTHRSPLAVAALVCLLAAFVYLLSYAGVLHAVDEQSALSVTASVLLGQGFHTNQMEWDQARTPPQNALGTGGNLYSKKGLGVSLLALPLFGLGETLPFRAGAVQVALLAGSLMAVLAVGAMFGLACSLGYSLRVAALGALLLAFGSPLWPYARTLFSETPGAAGLALALWGMAAWRRTWMGRRSPWLLMAGSGLALLILVKSSNAVVVPFFGLYWLWGAWEQNGRGRKHGAQASRLPALASELVALGGPVLLAVAATVAYNYARFGTTFGFPLESFETFSTPLFVGLAGLLFSPGKGIFWYFPALWLGVAFIGRWRQGGRLPDYLLAAAAALGLIVVYALWYDWPGGRAWGPRMIITAIPALAVLVLPALDWLFAGSDLQAAGGQHGHVGVPATPHVGVRTGQESDSPAHLATPSPRHSLTRALVIAVLLLSVAVQLPGVLVNFERQEELDMQAGATFEQLLWAPAHSPLLTYWQHIGATPDPLWLQPYLRTQPPALLLAPVAGALLAATALLLAAWHIRRQQRAGPLLGLAGLALLLLAILLPPLAYDDPRWDDRSAVREDNRAIMQSVQELWQAGDVVLLDLLESSDKGRRTGQWLNFARREPSIGWLRKTPLDGVDGERLAGWLLPYRRAWLVLQGTDEGDSDSTTEAWLNHRAFAGRRWWVGDQRVVEYFLPTGAAGATGGPAAGATTMTGPFQFGAAVVLDRLDLVQAAGQDAVRMTLAWQAVDDADVRYSVQALDAGGQVLAQTDGVPGSLGGTLDRIGLWLPPGVERLILKVYRASDGGILPVTGPAGESGEFLALPLS